MVALGQPSKIGEHLSLGEARRIADEICSLASAQRDALQKAPYILMSRAEREAYDRRRDHIKQLGETLARFKPKDTDAVD
jgi:hypothetical protein